MLEYVVGYGFQVLGAAVILIGGAFAARWAGALMEPWVQVPHFESTQAELNQAIRQIPCDAALNKTFAKQLDWFACDHARFEPYTMTMQPSPVHLATPKEDRP
jgi:hypothetical protein